MKILKIISVVMCFIFASVLIQFIFSRIQYLNIAIFNEDILHLWKDALVWVFGGLYLTWRFFIAKKPNQKKDIVFLLSLLVFTIILRSVLLWNFDCIPFASLSTTLVYAGIGLIALGKADNIKYQKALKYIVLLVALYFLIDWMFGTLSWMSDEIQLKDNFLSVGPIRGLVWFTQYSIRFLIIIYFSSVAYCLWQELGITKLILQTKKRLIK